MALDSEFLEVGLYVFSGLVEGCSLFTHLAEGLLELLALSVV
jgi:hypothetical protein